MRARRASPSHQRERGTPCPLTFIISSAGEASQRTANRRMAEAAGRRMALRMTAPFHFPRMRGKQKGAFPRVRGKQKGASPRVRGKQKGAFPRVRGNRKGAFPTASWKTATRLA